MAGVEQPIPLLNLYIKRTQKCFYKNSELVSIPGCESPVQADCLQVYSIDMAARDSIGGLRTGLARLFSTLINQTSLPPEEIFDSEDIMVKTREEMLRNLLSRLISAETILRHPEMAEAEKQRYMRYSYPFKET